MRFHDAAPPRRRLSLTPLIDVVFLLLVFFMLSSSFIHWRRVDLQAGVESAHAEPQSTEERWVTVRVNGCGDAGVTLDGKPVALDAIGQRLSGFDLDHTHARVIVEDETALMCLVGVLDALEEAKVTSATVDGLIK